MINSKRTARWEPIIFRPECPPGWNVQEQMDGVRNSYITFVKKGKIHHKAEPSSIYVVFCEFAPGTQNFLYTVRGGKYAKPDEKLKYFTDLKSATDYVIYVMESTDRWLEEINSEKYIKAYEDRIAKLVEEEEKRQRRMREALES
jgi:hypothetical protein